MVLVDGKALEQGAQVHVGAQEELHAVRVQRADALTLACDTHGGHAIVPNACLMQRAACGIHYRGPKRFRIEGAAEGGIFGHR